MRWRFKQAPIEGPPPDVDHIWVGHTTSDSILVSAKVADVEQVRLAVSSSPTMSLPTYGAPVEVNEYGYAKPSISGLSPNTRYYLAIAGAGPNQVDANVVATARTPPTTEARSFAFVAASCAATGATGHVFNNIVDLAEDEDVEFGLHMGDFHYRNTGNATLATYHSDYDLVFASADQAEMYRAMPWYYMRDDHEVADDSYSGTAGTANWITLYRTRVPSPPLANESSSAPPYYSFVKGRLRFVVCDCRSDRSIKSATDNSAKVMYGSSQLSWLFGEFAAAESAGQAIVWVNTLPWIAATEAGVDTWGGYNTQRTAIASHITSEGYSNRIVMLSGDMHALAFDDGSNAAGGFKVCHAAPFYQTQGPKGGPYSDGPVYETGSQYGLFTVTDTGGSTVSINFKGIVVNQGTGFEVVELNETFSLQAD